MSSAGALRMSSPSRSHTELYATGLIQKKGSCPAFHSQDFYSLGFSSAGAGASAGASAGAGASARALT